LQLLYHLMVDNCQTSVVCLYYVITFAVQFLLHQCVFVCVCACVIYSIFTDLYDHSQFHSLSQLYVLHLHTKTLFRYPTPSLVYLVSYSFALTHR